MARFAGPDDMNHPLRCRCGMLQGHVVPARSSRRAVCYCEDCQAYARHLDVPGVTDSSGGTEVVASLPRQVHFSQGQEQLACLSLSRRGLLRWYAACCRAPIGNTPRNPRLAYVGLVHSCLGTDRVALERAFGPLRMAVNTGSSLAPVPSRPIVNALGMAHLAMTLMAARISGLYRQNPFFVADSGEPIRQPRVLSPAERKRAYDRT